MNARAEPVAWAALLVALSTLVAVEGRRRAELERQIPVAPQELYRTLAHSRTSWQIVDVRADVADGYEDSHIPGAVPLPGCDLARAPQAARDRIYTSVPTVIVSTNGDAADVHRCFARFTGARRLAGGMAAWVAAKLPEDSGEYAPPSVKAGGGCL
ncbi:MAG TPA: rhodanese-like domain-containing protein [Anaeromyxobacteraceae bacterium]